MAREIGERYSRGRGFAAMAPDKQREIARKGGIAAHVKGTAHEWSSAEARIAGRKGGTVARGGRGKAPGSGEATEIADARGARK